MPKGQTGSGLSALTALFSSCLGVQHVKPVGEKNESKRKQQKHRIRLSARSAAVVGPVSSTCSCLQNMPVEVVEIICQSLPLRDRVSLTSCCRSLWVREDIAGSAALWGDLDLEIGHGHLETQAARELSLSMWLARRRGGQRRLRLKLYCQFGNTAGRPGTDAVNPVAFLGRSDSSPLIHLQLSPMLIDEGAFEAWYHIDATLAELPPLSSHLTALTRLSLSECGLETVPKQLGTHTALADLNLENQPLGRGGPAAFAPLDRLTALTRLQLGGCSLQAVPSELSAMVQLADVDLSHNVCLGRGGEEMLHPLRNATGLTRLVLSHCGLESTPSLLASLTTLLDVDLSNNEGLGAAQVAGWCVPLSGLVAVTRLSLSSCALRTLPEELSLLHGMQVLELRGNAMLGLGGGKDFRALAHLTNLTRLDLSFCALSAVPPQLGLGCHDALSHLTLEHNRRLGESGPASLVALEALAPSLSGLDLSDCALSVVPPVLGTLESLRDLSLARNRLLGEAAPGAWNPLPALGLSLTRLSLRHTGLQRLPAQLACMDSLAELALTWTRALEDAAPDSLALLRHLPSLKCLDVGKASLPHLEAMGLKVKLARSSEGMR